MLLGDSGGQRKFFRQKSDPDMHSPEAEASLRFLAIKLAEISLRVS
jgi:hypothetical protein